MMLAPASRFCCIQGPSPRSCNTHHVKLPLRSSGVKHERVTFGNKIVGAR